ncbi:helix-turn-helix domain-containing protein [Aeromicrobium sp. 9AM]|uniref:helix-turn-helix domain-containing protein n=1 Tax=Aeromicrobium sp. 9AM TaxID=2653126 RepID=UPI0012EF4584|nr:helix-turn-helix domain-containing protein [Aeromicrobium sp. 9AM]VXB62157.1 XRE family transcriptional regulator [Aeromicrobium sp. 9AM]
MTDSAEALALNVRRLRETHGLSLAQVSERSGIAKATLFKVERGRTNPTLETLVGIADTFHVAVTDLLALPEQPSVDVVRKGGGQDISDDSSTGAILRNQAIGAGSLQIHHQTFHAGISEISASHGAGAREHVLVRSGKITVGPVGYEVQIGAGDYATYVADQPHRWATDNGAASVWIVHTFPRGQVPDPL